MSKLRSLFAVLLLATPAHAEPVWALQAQVAQQRNQFLACDAAADPAGCAAVRYVGWQAARADAIQLAQAPVEPRAKPGEKCRKASIAKGPPPLCVVGEACVNGLCTGPTTTTTSTTLVGATTTTQPTSGLGEFYRPEAWHMGLTHKSKTEEVKYHPVTGASFPQPWCLQRMHQLVFVNMPRAFRLAMDVPACASQLGNVVELNFTDQTMSEFTMEDSILQAPTGYQCRAPLYDRERSYQHAERLQTCILKDPVRAAASPYATPDTLDFLAMRRVAALGGDFLMAGARSDIQTLAPDCKQTKNPVCDDTRRMDGQLDGRHAILTPLTPAQVAMVHATHEAHVACSTAIILGTDRAVCATVKPAHEALQRSARSFDELLLVTMTPFLGDVDARQSPDRIAQRFRLADEAHERWMAAVLRLDLVEAWRMRLKHARQHVLLGLGGDPRIRVREVCDGLAIGDCLDTNE